MYREKDKACRKGRGIDWIEDFSHENGNYQRECCRCHVTFVGHKRRVICRKCVKGPNKLYYLLPWFLNGIILSICFKNDAFVTWGYWLMLFWTVMLVLWCEILENGVNKWIGKR